MPENETTTDAATTADPVATEAPDEAGLYAAGRAVLAKEREAARAADKRANDAEARIKEYEDRDKSQADKDLEEREALKSENASLKSSTLRRDIAEEKGLTLAQAKRLVGTTREELEADADDVLTTFAVAPVKQSFGDVGQGHRTDGAARVYRESEIKDHAFWRANKTDINLALTQGRVVPD